MIRYDLQCRIQIAFDATMNGRHGLLSLRIAMLQLASSRTRLLSSGILLQYSGILLCNRRSEERFMYIWLNRH